MSTDGHAEDSFLCHSGMNFNMSPSKCDLRITCTVNQSSIFGDKEKLQTLAMGEMSLQANVQGKYTPMKIPLKGVTLVSWTILLDVEYRNDSARRMIFCRLR